MAVSVDQLRIIHYPDPILRRQAKPVAEVTDEIRAVAARMIQLMHEARGVGLAAPQVGLDWRLFVANATGTADPDEDRVYINPELVEPGRDTESREEGCLSLPGINGDITRPTRITIRALDEHGRPFERTAEGFEARVWQHETDHLDGIMIIDRMPPLDRMASRRALRELEESYRQDSPISRRP